MPHVVRRSSLAPSLASLALVLTLSLAPGCEGDAPADIHSYVDSAGRSCTVDANDISGTASCDADPGALVTCEAGKDPVFTLDDDYDFTTHVWTLRSCAGCIDRPNHTTGIESSTCASVTCSADADCIRGSYACTSGLCQHM